MNLIYALLQYIVYKTWNDWISVSTMITPRRYPYSLKLKQ